MTSSSNQQSQVRRQFLRAASATSLGALGIASINGLSSAAEGNLGDQVQLVNCGVRPTQSSPGAVVLPREACTYISFHAHPQFAGWGHASSDGTALIQWTGCEAWRTRCAGDASWAEHAIDLDSLEPCQTYEIHNSPWAHGRRLRHFVVTFRGLQSGISEGGTHFECLAEKATVGFFPKGSFAKILRGIEDLDSVAGTPLQLQA